MAKRTPLTNDDGDFIRELTDEDMPWFVRSQDCTSWEEAHEFLLRREDILEKAEALGIPREAFLSLDPGKPGFEERVRDAFGQIADFAGMAAE
jgi:hypothetical protein